ncbi:MAG: 3-phosphoshikimate 1-carboxyvinyltransferase [Sphingobacteriaceae bacterium]|nr:3-phosphoshikimate 1-carboxyvinyltransferase [Sphingobacteriaceae bacterium]
MSKNAILSFPSLQNIDAEINLTGSKSECNRALVIAALSKGKVLVNNLSIAKDTTTLHRILSEIETDLEIVDVGPAGTAMRFLTALLPTRAKKYTLTGSERMKERPIGILVDALNHIGANITYLEKEGFPPIQINEDFKQITNKIQIKGDISSQYISALLMIAPTLPMGLVLEIVGDLTSKPYVEMTLSMLQNVGIKHTWEDNVITIETQEFKPTTLFVEPDWSAASYWYSIATLSEKASIFLTGLNGYSLQGDSVITEIMANFGITSQFINNGVQLKKEPKKIERKIFDCKECPDLAQTIIVCCAILGHEATFTGLETLKIKETDRILALQNEIAKIGVKLIERNLSYKLDCSGLFFPEKLVVKTYDDHRMAMAFAPLALKIKTVEIEDMDVVEKSYPNFWIDLQKVGFIVNTN